MGRSFPNFVHSVFSAQMIIAPYWSVEEILACGLLIEPQKRTPAHTVIRCTTTRFPRTLVSHFCNFSTLKRDICRLKVVWNGSMEIGVGSAISKTYGFISVARYSPKGGEGGPQAFRKNVFAKGIITCCCICQPISLGHTIIFRYDPSEGKSAYSLIQLLHSSSMYYPSPKRTYRGMALVPSESRLHS